MNYYVCEELCKRYNVIKQTLLVLVGIITKERSFLAGIYTGQWPKLMHPAATAPMCCKRTCAVREKHESDMLTHRSNQYCTYASLFIKDFIKESKYFKYI